MSKKTFYTVQEAVTEKSSPSSQRMVFIKSVFVGIALDN